MNRWYLRLLSIAILPLLGFWLERQLDEPFAGPGLFMLYAVGLLAFAMTLTGRPAPPVLSVVAGVLGTGSFFAGIFAVLGTLAATTLLAMVATSLFIGPPRSAYDHMRGIAAGVTMAAIMVSPWLTSVSLGQLTLQAIRSSSERFGAFLTAICAILGAILTAAAMMLAVSADASWLAHRLRAFDTDDIASWETSLSEIKSRWLCGHRRCLMPVCDKLMGRFGRTAGARGSFVSPIGFALEAPKVSPEFALPFVRVYGHPVTHVCAVGD